LQDSLVQKRAVRGFAPFSDVVANAAEAFQAADSIYGLGAAPVAGDIRYVENAGLTGGGGHDIENAPNHLRALGF